MLIQNPRNLILIDAAGACLTVFLTAFLLATQVLDTGLPPSILYIMAAVAALYGVFGFCGFIFKLETSKVLRVLAVLNFLYGAAAISICVMFRKEITTVGIIYFSTETIILFALAAFELLQARRSPA